MMASRAVVKIKGDWSKITSKVTPEELTRVNKLKAQIDSVATKTSNLPATLPKIDWAHYKQHAHDPKVVDELEKAYNSLKVERPRANPAKLDELALNQRQDEERFKRFAVAAKSFIQSAEVVKKKFEDMIPVAQMTSEDWELTFPYWGIAQLDNPSVYPHHGRIPGLTREEQIVFEQPHPVPWSTKSAWRDWEERKKKFYSD